MTCTQELETAAMSMARSQHRPASLVDSARQSRHARREHAERGKRQIDDAGQGIVLGESGKYQGLLPIPEVAHRRQRAGEHPMTRRHDIARRMHPCGVYVAADWPDWLPAPH